jgi:hypothetical protein
MRQPPRYAQRAVPKTTQGFTHFNKRKPLRLVVSLLLFLLPTTLASSGRSSENTGNDILG